MSSDMTEPVAKKRIALRYVLYYLGAMVAVIAVVLLIEYFAGKTFSGTSGSLIPAMVAALGAGQWWHGHEKAIPTSARVWRMTLICFGISMVFQAVLVWLAYLIGIFDGMLSGGLSQQGLVAIFAAIMVFFAIVQFLMTRIGFSIGIKAAHKASLKAAKV